MVKFPARWGHGNIWQKYGPRQKILPKNPTPGEKFLPIFSNCDFDLKRKRLQTFLKAWIRKLSLRAFSTVAEDYIFKTEKDKYRIEPEKQIKIYCRLFMHNLLFQKLSPFNFAHLLFAETLMLYHYRYK